MTQLHEQRDRATSFGSIAPAYDQFRPSYPDALVRHLLDSNPHDVLDVGCGTGIASRLFTAQGCRVLGVEPDPAMAEFARRGGTDVEIATFEQWDAAGRRFDLLVSGQAWHWVEPDAGAIKAAAVLRPGGRVGLFWNTDSMRDDDRSLLNAAYEKAAPQLVGRSYGGRRGVRTTVRDALSRAGFRDVVQREFSWRRRYTPEQYVQLAGTFSDHTLLPADERAALFAALGEAVTAAGDLDVDYECQLVSAIAP